LTTFSSVSSELLIFSKKHTLPKNKQFFT
jgi:hypothetical protein